MAEFVKHLIGLINVTIVSDDIAIQPGSLQFSGATYNASETNAMVTIIVTRTGGSDGAVTVAYATSNGTATAGSDYTATSGTLSFATGETSKTFNVTVLNDTSHLVGIQSPAES